MTANTRKFLAGDLVRRIVVDSPQPEMTVGSVWTVRYTDTYGGSDWLCFDNGRDGPACFFELVSPAEDIIGYAEPDIQNLLPEADDPLDVEAVADAVFETYFADDVLDIAPETSVIFTIPLEEALGAISSYLSEKHGGLSVTLEGFSSTTTDGDDTVLLLSGTVL